MDQYLAPCCRSAPHTKLCVAARELLAFTTAEMISTEGMQAVPLAAIAKLRKAVEAQ